MKLKSCITALLILLYWNSYGQQSNETRKRTAVETALLDSAYRYEKLKPTFYHLEAAYVHQSKESEALRKALFTAELQKQLYDKNINEQKRRARKQFWKGVKVGGLGTIGIAAALLIF